KLQRRASDCLFVFFRQELLTLCFYLTFLLSLSLSYRLSCTKLNHCFSGIVYWIKTICCLQRFFFPLFSQTMNRAFCFSLSHSLKQWIADEIFAKSEAIGGELVTSESSGRRNHHIHRSTSLVTLIGDCG
ncbi:unnamed protein product, partial [Arabidopsis halleri]